MQVLTIVTVSGDINSYRVYREIKRAISPTAQGVSFSHISGDDHTTPSARNEETPEPHPILARLRANADAGVQLCVCTAEATNIERTPMMVASADFVLLVVDALGELGPEPERIAGVCRELGTKFGFVLAGCAISETDESLVRDLVKQGPVAPVGILAPSDKPNSEMASPLWKFLKVQMSEERKFEKDERTLATSALEDRRVYRRWRLSLPAKLHGGGEITVKDISGSGLMFEGTAECRPGDRLQLAIPTVGPLEAEVIWSADGRIGARFLVSDGTSRRLAKKLQDLVDERRKAWLAEKRRKPAGDAGETGRAQQRTGSPADTGATTLGPPARGGPVPDRREQQPKVIVIMNTKGGTGKSTLCIHLAISLMYAGERVVGLDLDRDQPTFATFARYRNANPTATRLPALSVRKTARDQIVDPASIRCDDGSRPSVIVVDTPGQRFSGVRRVALDATCIIVPINDSFVDFDVLKSRGNPHQPHMRLPGLIEALQEMTKPEAGECNVPIAVLRNRLNPLLSRNKIKLSDAVGSLCHDAAIVQADAMTERVVYREHFDQGLTVFDTGQSPESQLTMSHLAARQEVRAIANWALRPARRGPGDPTGPAVDSAQLPAEPS